MVCVLGQEIYLSFCFVLGVDSGIANRNLPQAVPPSRNPRFFDLFEVLDFGAHFLLALIMLYGDFQPRLPT